MASSETHINALTTLLVTLDPPGLAPVFLALTAGMTRDQRSQVALRGSIIAFGILAVFALFGLAILNLLGISLGAFRIALSNDDDFPNCPSQIRRNCIEARCK